MRRQANSLSYIPVESPSIPDDAASASGHNFFAVLIGAFPFGYDVQETITLFSRRQCNDTFDCVAGKYRTMKSERHLARDQIKISTNLRRQRRG